MRRSDLTISKYGVKFKLKSNYIQMAPLPTKQHRSTVCIEMSSRWLFVSVIWIDAIPNNKTYNDFIVVSFLPFGDSMIQQASTKLIELQKLKCTKKR